MERSQTKTIVLASALLVAGFLAAALLLFREQTVGFIWQYLWGPVVADAHNQNTMVYHGITAQRGYNIYNTAIYAAGAVAGMLGLTHLIRRFDIGKQDSFIYGFIPLMVFGGLLRVVEDTGMLSYPLNVVLISPIIYFTVLIVALVLLFTSLRIGGRDDYWKYLAGSSTAALLIPLGLLGRYSLQHGVIPQTPFLLGLPTVSIAVVLTAQQLLKQVKPGTYLNSTAGMFAAAGHVLDGAATAYSIQALGYSEKHVIARWIINTSGTPYTFLLVKAVFILLILGLIEQEEDRFTVLVVLAITALGIGIGT
ncbi:MAG: DUF63 family protein, partial [Candidatus Nanohaloarchaea archaeon]|nr:DUF63 family protein [Candidatus Nanohaloarchaea archaeon]